MLFSFDIGVDIQIHITQWLDLLMVSVVIVVLKLWVSLIFCMFVGHQLVLTLRCTAGSPSGFYLHCFAFWAISGKTKFQNIGKILSLVLKQKCVFVLGRKYIFREGSGENQFEDFS